MMVLFTKAGCDKCDFIKSKLLPGAQVKILDIETPDGLSELAYLSLTGEATKTLPILVDYEIAPNSLPTIKEIYTGAINIKNALIEKGMAVN